MHPAKLYVSEKTTVSAQESTKKSSQLGLTIPFEAVKIVFQFGNSTTNSKTFSKENTEGFELTFNDTTEYGYYAIVAATDYDLYGVNIYNYDSSYSEMSKKLMGSGAFIRFRAPTPYVTVRYEKSQF